MAVMESPEKVLRRLQFKVVRRLDGFLFGDYRGLFYGPSLDLAEVREYQPARGWTSSNSPPPPQWSSPW